MGRKSSAFIGKVGQLMGRRCWAFIGINGSVNGPNYLGFYRDKVRQLLGFFGIRWVNEI